ncbi:MAG: M20/M25/M40 family metallo-hydrolase [Myxococcales bacterium]|nr:M20/M25/M40 family metallo-hydrolase [Myxococcales bacterium]MDH3482691.1 M20/M25/M40 family metallo-hydrolase [Myxococcales bacterium]
MADGDRELTEHSFRLCQQLLRIDTTNPPGNEREAAELVAEELNGAGLEPVVLESAPQRTNVVARLRGTGEKRPLLLTAHLDVVEADPSAWEHPPFCGEVHDGCLWGRGAIDMKNMAAMSVAIMARLARDGIKPKRDLIFAAVADEEAGCRYGSLWLSENHPDLVRSEYAIGEGGGFNIQVAGRTFFTVEVAEKGVCWMRARATGDPGHGSMPRDDSAVVKLSEAIAKLGKEGLPLHGSEPVRGFIGALASHLPAPLRPIIKLLASPSIGPAALNLLPDPSLKRAFRALLGNTASPTVLRAGNKTNVIPGLAEAEIDGRILPGQTKEDLIRELQAVLGPEIELEVFHSFPPMITEPKESSLYSTIHEVMAERAPGAPVVPFVLQGFTDATAFTRLGARWYGFSPVRLPPTMRFADMFHGHNERIPVDGLAWGTETLLDVVRRCIEA